MFSRLRYCNSLDLRQANLRICLKRNHGHQLLKPFSCLTRCTEYNARSGRGAFCYFLNQSTVALFETCDVALPIWSKVGFKINILWGSLTHTPSHHQLEEKDQRIGSKEDIRIEKGCLGVLNIPPLCEDTVICCLGIAICSSARDNT